MTAPGAPGIRPSWTSSAKDIVGTAMGASRLWFTLGYGIVNEVYHPRVDLPQIRDLGFIVADGRGFWTEVKRNADYTLATAGPGIPAVQVVHRHSRFELTLRIAPERDRDVLLIEAVLTGDADLRLHVLLAPHCGGTGEGNTATIRRERGRLLLSAEQGGHALALAASDPATQGEAWARASAGFVGTSDGWQDFAANGAMRWEYDAAGPGNVALLGELRGPSAVLALGFAPGPEAAATLALSALLQPFDAAWHRHVEAWEAWQAGTVDPDACQDEFREAAHVSAMVLRVHQDKTFLGAMVASLSIPWGSSTDDPGGYHLVWPRDLVESAGALLALGGWEEARNILRYLIATQQEDGRWAQNQWLGGKAHWTGIQLDEAAFPVLLASALAEADALGGIQPGAMVRKALRFIALYGPATDQDRWEETPGINTFTIAAAIAALVCGAELLGPGERRDLLLLADDWNSRIEDWCLGADPGIVARHGIPAYYVRAASPAVFADRAGIRDAVPVRNHDGECLVPADTLISTDPLQLVRFGLRRADDPAIAGTIRLIDAMLRVETPSGPSWYRYNGDGYGEHEDGSPFNGTGRGRPWPLLTGERGHYELAAGRDAEARDLLRAMTRMGSRLGLLPEQVWEVGAIPEHFLFPGRPSGSAMPLVWAHAEFMKLAASLRLGRPIDRPEPVWLRYGGQRPRAAYAHWSRRMPIGWIRAGQGLRLLLREPALIRWPQGEAWTTEGALGLHRADLPTEALAPGERFAFSIAGEPECEIRIAPAGG